MLINFDTLIPEALARQGEEWKKFILTLIANGTQIQIGVRRNFEIFGPEYKIKFTVTNWGKYIKEVK